MKEIRRRLAYLRLQIAYDGAKRGLQLPGTARKEKALSRSKSSTGETEGGTHEWTERGLVGPMREI